MTIQDFKERLVELDYVYIAFPNKEAIIEFTDPEIAHIYAKTFGGIFWDHFPHVEYGFEDPYNFANTWVVTNANGNIIEYNVTEKGVEEVVLDGSF